jgi:hypothetical protein
MTISIVVLTIEYYSTKKNVGAIFFAQQDLSSIVKFNLVTKETKVGTNLKLKLIIKLI